MAVDPRAVKKAAQAQDRPPSVPSINAQARTLHPGTDAAAKAFAALAFREAPAIGVLGDRGSGKSTAMKFLIAEYHRRSVGLVLVCDDKDPRRPQFEGHMRGSVADCIGDPPKPPIRTVVFRGNVITGTDVEPDTVASYGWKLATRGRPVLLAYDELAHDRLTTYGQWQSGITWVPRCFSKGRSLQVGSLWGTQIVQNVPQTAFDCSSHIFCFKLAGQGLAKLRERDYLTGDVERVIASLKGEPHPPAERGEFVLLERGRAWDGKIYKFGAAAAG
jgi:energy-coupling factor transporter ATP-binding protein EcfA2